MSVDSWSARVETQKLLEAIACGIEPNRAATAAVPRGKLMWAHVFALLRELPKFITQKTGIRDRGLMLQRWLVYLGSTAAIPVLQLPTDRTNASKRLLAHCERVATSHAKRHTDARKQLAQACKRNSATAEQAALAALAELQEEEAAQFDHEALGTAANGGDSAATGGTSSAGGGGGGGGGGGATAVWFDATAALQAVEMGLHPRLGAGSALTVLDGELDVLQMIAAHVRGGMPPRRPMAELRQLRCIAALQQRELVALREHLSELEVEAALSERRAKQRAAGAVASALEAAADELNAAAKAEGEAHARDCFSRLMPGVQKRVADARGELREAERLRLEADATVASQLAEQEKRQLELERLRRGRAGGRDDRMNELKAKLAVATQRRTANQRRLGEANLDRQRWQVAQAKLQELSAVDRDTWRSHTPDKIAELEAALASLTVHAALFLAMHAALTAL